jgi:uncharacterized protein YndB with AHSA1/START domain
MQKPTFVYVTYINSTPEKVWEALTQPEFTRQYWGGHAVQSDWKPGGAVKFVRADGSIDIKGEVLQYDPPKVLSYTWKRDASVDVVAEETRVTFEIATAFGATRLTVTHDQFEPEGSLYKDVSKGWPAVLSNLKTFLEKGKAIEFAWPCQHGKGT